MCGMKSRSGWEVKECIGCLDVGSDRCKECLGRPQDKRRSSEKESN